MKRPGQWDLLGYGSDPLPADLPAVEHQAKHYADVATLIDAQAARLRSIGHGNNDLVGKYAKNLEEKSGDLADDLEKVHGRYAGVGSALHSYIQPLDHALSETWGALQDAVAARQAQQSAAAMADPKPDPGKQLTSAQQQQATQRHNAIGKADDQMTAAKNRLAGALSDLNDAAKRVASRINDASDDDLTDSFWDKLENILVEIVKVVVDIAGYIAIACAVIMLFVPGLDILATIALAATIASLVGHTALALTGNGSWLDVAIDVVALATFGLGRFAGEGMRATEEATAEAGTRAAARSQGAFNRQLSSVERRIASGTGRARSEAIAERAAMRGTRPIRAAAFARQMRLAESDTSRAWQFGGDMSQAGPYSAVRRGQELMPNSTAVARASAPVGRYANLGRSAWVPGQIVPMADKVAGQSAVVPSYHGSDAYNAYKERFTYQVLPW